MRRTLTRRTPEPGRSVERASPPSSDASPSDCPECGCRCSHTALDVARRRARMVGRHDDAGPTRERLLYALRVAGGLAVLFGRRVAPGLGLVAARDVLPGLVGRGAVFFKGGVKLLGGKALVASGAGALLLAGIAWLGLGRGSRRR